MAERKKGKKRVARMKPWKGWAIVGAEGRLTEPVHRSTPLGDTDNEIQNHDRILYGRKFRLDAEARSWGDRVVRVEVREVSRDDG